MDSSSAAVRRPAARCCVRAARAAASGFRSSPERGVPNRAQRARFGFGPDRRLARSADFERLLKQGTRRSVSGYTFYIERRGTGTPRLGIMVSRRHSAKATERNGIKRCIREAFRLEQSRLEGMDVLIRPPLGVRASAAMLARVRELFARIAP